MLGLDEESRLIYIDILAALCRRRKIPKPKTESSQHGFQLHSSFPTLSCKKSRHTGGRKRKWVISTVYLSAVPLLLYDWDKWGFGIALRVMVVVNNIGVVAAYLQTILDIYNAANSGQAWSSIGNPNSQCFLSVLFGGWLFVMFLEKQLPDLADWGSLIANLALVALAGVLFWLIFVERLQSPMVEQPEIDWWTIIKEHGPNLVFAFSSAEYVLRPQFLQYVTFHCVSLWFKTSLS